MKQPLISISALFFHTEKDGDISAPKIASNNVLQVFHTHAFYEGKKIISPDDVAQIFRAGPRKQENYQRKSMFPS